MLKHYRTLLPFVRKYWLYYCAGIISLVLSSGGQLIIPQFIRQAIDTVVSGTFRLGTIGILMVQLTITAIVIAITRFGWRHFIHGASRRIESELREQLFDRLLTLSGSFYRRLSPGDIMARATNDLQTIRMASGIALVSFIDGLFMTVAILIILFASNGRLALAIIAPLPLISILVIGSGKMISRIFRRVQESFSTISEEAREAITGIRVIKAYVKESYFLRRFSKTNDDYRRHNLAYVRIWALLFPLVTLLSGLTLLLLLNYGGEAILDGRMTPGDFVATMSYLELMIWPMIGAGFTVTMLVRGATSLRRINEILDEEPEIVGAEAPGAPIGETSITIRNLTFRYAEEGAPALSDISLEMPSGNLIGIFGRTGSGKTTLVQLLSRLIDPPRGTIFLGNHDLHDYTLETLRGAIAYAPQDVFLFSATIRENILFAIKEQDEELLRRVADISTISRDLDALPSGFDTPVGERGVTLSGGQKQRTAISRALAVDAPILILDDALSAVDTETEQKILSALLRWRAGKTTLLISHRVSILRHCSTIFVIDGGRLLQSGAHDYLTSVPGLYNDIHTLQQLEAQTPV